MRLFAIIMMIQGHSIHVFLAEEFRTPDSLFFTIWNFNRGFTAPIFMFTAGVVFTYLLFYQKLGSVNNQRVKKGLKRFFILLFVGYLLHFPTLKLHHLAYVTEAQWKLFYKVDALQLIAFGLLTILFLVYLAKLFQINVQYTFIIFTFLMFGISPISSEIEWANILPLPIAAYFYKGTGSFFPIFPWLGYITAGAILGAFLAKQKYIIKTVKFGFILLITGVLLILLSQLLELIYTQQFPTVGWLEISISCFYRLGYVFLISAVLFWVSQRVTTIPKYLLNLSKHSLAIYVVHLIILYGSVLSVGINYFWGKQFSVYGSIVAALVMIVLMTLLANIIENYKISQAREILKWISFGKMK